jgi:hypothetical protein
MSNFLIVSGYLGFVMLGVVLALMGRLRPNRLAPLSELLKYIMRHRITRIALFMTWWWLGWHFLGGTNLI